MFHGQIPGFEVFLSDCAGIFIKKQKLFVFVKILAEEKAELQAVHIKSRHAIGSLLSETKPLENTIVFFGFFNRMLEE